MVTTEQESGDEARFELNGYKTEKVCEDATEHTFSVQVCGEAIICSCDRNIQNI